MANTNQKKYLVLGHRGFIGSHLFHKLEADGLDLKDGLDAADEKNYTQKYQTIIHLAAHLQPTDDADIKLHRTVLTMAKKMNAHVIYASSASVYQPDNLYAVQKLYGEALFKDYGILRFFNVYGGGNGIVDKIKTYREAPLQIHGNGEQTRDFVHVEDVVEAILKAVKIQWQGLAEIGTGSSISINQLLNLYDVLDYEYVDKDPGILQSQADLNPYFPWRAIRTLG